MTANGETSHGHDRVEELLALMALDGLRRDEEIELDRLRAETGHCQECAQLQRDYLESAAQLAYALHPAHVPERVGHRLFDATIGARPEPRDQEVAGQPSIQRRRGRHAVRRGGGTTSRRRSQGRRRVLAAAASMVLLLGGGVGGFVAGDALRSPPQSDVSAAPAGLTAFLADPKTRLASFPTKNDNRVSIAYRPDGRNAWIVANGLARPSGGTVYQLWHAAPGIDGVRSSGTFVPDRAGDAVVRTTIDRATTELAISVEPEGGSPQPTADPIMAVRV